MSQALDYENPRHARSRWMLVTAANAFLFYPLAIAAAVYGTWFRTWHLLGRLPRLGRDVVPFGAAPLVTMAYVGIFAAIPVFLIGIPVNALYLHNSGASNRRCAIRFAVLIVIWSFTATLLSRDPMNIVVWVLGIR